MDSAYSGAYMTDMSEASGGTPGLPPGLTEVEAVELQLELTKVEDEIQTLRQVLSAKEKHAADLRRRLGINPLAEFKHNISRGWQEVQSSNAYMRTSQTLEDLNHRVTTSNFYLTASATVDDISRSETVKKTSAALSSVGSTLRSKLEGLRTNYSMRHSLSMPAMRNSSTIKSLEEKMSKAVGSKSDNEVSQPPPASGPTL